MQTLNIGLIGTGFMGRTHSNAYSQVGKFFPHDDPARAQGRLCPQPADYGGVCGAVGVGGGRAPIGRRWSHATTST